MVFGGLLCGVLVLDPLAACAGARVLAAVATSQFGPRAFSSAFSRPSQVYLFVYSFALAVFERVFVDLFLTVLSVYLVAVSLFLTSGLYSNTYIHTFVSSSSRSLRFYTGRITKYG